MKLRMSLFLMMAVMLAIMLSPRVVHAEGTPTRSWAETTYKVYVVKEGDTLGTIARKFGVTIAAIKKANHLDVERIYVGQKLRIPTRQTQVIATQGQVLATRPPGFIPPNAYKWIEVDLSQQRLYAYENGQLVFKTLISSGVAGHRTPVGRFRIWAKIRRQTMSGPGYNLPNVQWVMYFAGENAIHGTYWHHNFGRPMSHGCVNATNRAARWLYQWAPQGTIVVVHR